VQQLKNAVNCIVDEGKFQCMGRPSHAHEVKDPNYLFTGFIALVFTG